MAKLVASVTLCVAVEAEVVFNLKCSREGSEAAAGSNVACFCASEREDHSGNAFGCTAVVR